MFEASQQQIIFLESHIVFISRGLVYISEISKHSLQIVQCLKNEYIIGTTDAHYNDILDAYTLYFLTKDSKVLRCLYKLQNGLNSITLEKSPQTPIIKNIAKIANVPFFSPVLLTKKGELLLIDPLKGITKCLNILKKPDKHFINVFGTYERQTCPLSFIITNNATYAFDLGNLHNFDKPKQVEIVINKKLSI